MSRPEVPQRSDLKWIGMDLDGTVYSNDWSVDNPTAPIGTLIPENMEKLCALVAAGYKIVIHTSRPWTDHEAICVALKYDYVPFSQVVCGKLMAAAYVDDRAISADHKDWLGEVKRINGN